MLTYRTAGESHGQALIALVEGLPSNVPVDFEFIDNELKRRQGGYGRGGRMKIEKDHVRFLSGVRHGKTLGSPVAMMIENRDWPNWEETMSVREVSPEATRSEPSLGRVRVTRISPAHSSSSRSTLEIFWNVPAPEKPRPVSLPEALPRFSSRSLESRSSVTRRQSELSACLRILL